MKRFNRFLRFGFFLSSVAFAQGPAIQWQRSFGGTAADDAAAAVQTTDGGYISAGQTASTNGDVTGNLGLNDFWVVKQDASGNPQWKKCLGGTADDYAECIRQTLDGGYVVVGGTSSGNGDVTFNHGADDVWLVKLDTGGTIEWQKTYGGSSNDVAYCVRQTPDKGYIIGGGTMSADGDVTGQHQVGMYDMWILKTDSLGNLQWQKALGGTSNDYAWDLIHTNDSGYIVAGITFSNNGDVSGNKGQCDYWIVKLDAAGNMQWQKSYGGAGTDLAHSILQTPDSGYIVCGSGYSFNGDQLGNHGSGDIWVLKLDTAGNIQWQKSYGGTNTEQGYGSQQTSDGGFVFAGFAKSSDGDLTINHGMYDLWVVKTDAAGTIQWQQAFGGSNNDATQCIKETADGGFMAAGSSSSNDGDATSCQGSYDFWLIKLGGITTPVPALNSTEQFVVYPNPATDIITLRYDGHLSGADYKITDLSGRVIAGGKLANTTEAINVNGLAPGVYVLGVSGESNASFRIIKQ